MCMWRWCRFRDAHKGHSGCGFGAARDRHSRPSLPLEQSLGVGERRRVFLPSVDVRGLRTNGIEDMVARC